MCKTRFCKNKKLTEWCYLKNWNYGGHERSYESEHLYYILARKDEQNSNTTKLSCVQQTFILLLLTNLCLTRKQIVLTTIGNFLSISKHGFIFKSSGQCNNPTDDFHKRFRVSINKFYRVIDRRNTRSILITLLESFLTTAPQSLVFIECACEEKKTTRIHRFLTRGSTQNAHNLVPRVFSLAWGRGGKRPWDRPLNPSF